MIKHELQRKKNSPKNKMFLAHSIYVNIYTAPKQFVETFDAK